MARRSFLFYAISFLYILNYANGYLCQNKPINIFGQCGPLLCPFFAATSKPYHDFRKQNNIDVHIEILPGDYYVNSGLIGTPDATEPVVFVGTHHDFELTKNEIKFPLIGQAMVIIFNIPGVDDLNITVSVIADIYKGLIKRWNDPRLSEINSNITLPNELIVPIARLGEEDATTGMFTKVLSANDQEWELKYGAFFGPKFQEGYCCNEGGSCCISHTWPQNVNFKFALDSVGTVAVVSSFDYTIGYATVNTIQDLDEIKFAKFLINKTLVQPDSSGIQKTMKDYVAANPGNNLDIRLDNFTSPNAYPLSFLSYMAVNFSYDQPTVDCCVIQEMVGYIEWLNSASPTEFLDMLGYASLITEFRDRIKQLVLNNIKCRKELMYKQYLSSLESINQMASWVTALIVAGSFIGLGLMIGIAYYVYYKKYYVDESKWMIDPTRIKLTANVANGTKGGAKWTDTTSLQSYTSEGSEKSTVAKGHSHSDGAGKERGLAKDLKEFMISADLDDNDVYMDSLECKIPQQWSSTGKRLVYKMKNFVCKNVATLLGVAVINNEPCAVFEYLTKGTLHYVLRTSRYNLTDEIKYQFTIDIGEGLKYLHQYGIVHGYLSSITCYVDSSWTVKIVQWERLSLYRQENYRCITEFATFHADHYLEESRLIECLYMDPNLLVNSSQQCVDVYSFGYLILEIFTRKLPFSEEVEDSDESYTNILKRKFIDRHPVHPRTNKIHKDLQSIVSACLSADELSRPSMTKVVKNLSRMSKISNGIVDIIMDTLEAQADALEDQVEERTSALKEVTDKMRNLLNEVLPPQIAEQLLRGESVAPEQFDCITVYFSDIVGFASMSIRSSPTEIMTLLNDLWNEFDNVIDKFDAYKADAIADNYMVCSGIPKRNGMDHIRQITLLSLALIDMATTFKIKHLPEEKLQIRIGINCGPATAGVIGSKMPQYCIFGDTVNTASRMESTSLPLKIQMSERAQKFLTENFPSMFDTEYRGEITVKGKGTQRTHWLHGLAKKEEIVN